MFQAKPQDNLKNSYNVETTTSVDTSFITSCWQLEVIFKFQYWHKFPEAIHFLTILEKEKRVVKKFVILKVNRHNLGAAILQWNYSDKQSDLFGD